MTTVNELMEQINKVIQTNEDTQAKLDKAMNRKLNTFYVFIVRLLSLAALVGCFYTAFLGFGASAAVLGFVFLFTWLIYGTAYAIVGGAKGYADGKAKELELEATRIREKNNVPLV